MSIQITQGHFTRSIGEDKVYCPHCDALIAKKYTHEHKAKRFHTNCPVHLIAGIPQDETMTPIEAQGYGKIIVTKRK